MAKKTIAQVDVAGKRVLMRVDFNVPLKDGKVADARRIRAALPTLKDVVQRGGRLICMSHLGRPKGEGPEPAFSLEVAAHTLRELIDPVPVHFVPDDCIGAAAQQAVADLEDGEILLLENLRFHKGEKKGDETFAAALAAYGDLYCNEAFGTAHRNHASMFTVPQAMAGRPRVAGFLLEKELKYLAGAIEHAQKPFIAILGGAKVSDKLGAIENLTGRVDTILVGGAMAYTFLKARGANVGKSLVEEDMLDTARGLLESASRSGTSIMLPTDHHCGKAPEAGTPFGVFAGDIDDGWMGLDIGPETVTAYGEVVKCAKTIVWNGPMGMFEVPPYDAGTRAVAEAICQATAAGAVSIIGGGDSAASIDQFGMNDRVSHVSTGGGASLQMLEGRAFDSVGLLDDA